MMFRNPEWMEMVADLFNLDISVVVGSKNEKVKTNIYERGASYLFIVESRKK